VPLHAGLGEAVELKVTSDDTAQAMRSGDVAVLATARLLSLIDEAACGAVNALLGAGQTTVGMRVQIDHLAPVSVGSTVRCDVTLEKVEGRRLTFTATVTDGSGLVAAGRVTRVIVEVDRFMEKAR
jgi:predicted thioesterase